jgi:phage shock protein E
MKTLVHTVITLFFLGLSAYAGDVTHVDAKQAMELLKKEEKPKVLDVRTPEEFAEGHLAGALNIDFLKSDFAEKVAKLDKDQPFLVHCRSGGRSTKSLATFEKLGFKNIIHLDGGMNAWTEAGGEVVK